MRGITTKLTLLAALGLALAALDGCNRGEDGAAPVILSLTATTTDTSDTTRLDGDALEVKWERVDGAMQYKVYAGETLLVTVTDTVPQSYTYTVDSTHQTSYLKVTAVFPEGEHVSTVSLSPVVTEGVLVYTRAVYDTLKRHLIWLHPDGSVTSNRPWDSTYSHFAVIGPQAGPFQLISNFAANPQYHGTAMLTGETWGGSLYAPEGGYADSLILEKDSVYYIWLDDAGDGIWSANCYYARMTVTGVDNLNGTVTTKWAVQAVAPGLRWLTD